MILVLNKSLKSDILWLRISEKLEMMKLNGDKTPLQKILVDVLHCFHFVFIIYVVSAGHIQIERPFKNAGGIKKKKNTHTQWELSVSPLRSKLFLWL